jgi:molecular chaperone GrpE (heat shock protein)
MKSSKFASEKIIKQFLIVIEHSARAVEWPVAHFARTPHIAAA